MLGSVTSYEILVVDSDLLGGGLIVDSLSRVGSWRVGPLASSSGQARVRCAERRQDLVVLSTSLAGEDFEPLAREILASSSPSRLLVMGRQVTDDQIRRVGSMSGAGFFDRESEGMLEFQAAVDFSLRGSTYWSPRLRQRRDEVKMKSSGWAGLKDRDRRLLQILAHGGSNQTAADELEISLRSVEKGLAAMRARLGLKTTAELMAHAIRDGIITV